MCGMSTVNFSVPAAVKQVFNETFGGQNKSAIIADLMLEAVERARRHDRSLANYGRIFKRRSLTRRWSRKPRFAPLSNVHPTSSPSLTRSIRRACGTRHQVRIRIAPHLNLTVKDAFSAELGRTKRCSNRHQCNCLDDLHGLSI